MAKIVKTYLSGCTWCNATGFVNNPNMGLTTNITIICPVCNGTKTVIVTETITDDIEMPDDEEIEKQFPTDIYVLKKNEYSSDVSITRTINLYKQEGAKWMKSKI
jgi:Ribonuclease G/E